MTFIQKMMAVFGKLKFVEKAQKKEMTAADWDAVRSAYKEEYGADFAADQQAYSASQNTTIEANRVEQENTTALQIITAALAQASVAENENQLSPASPTDVVAAATQIAAAITTMAQTAIIDAPRSVGNVTLSVNGPGHTDSHFCGIDHPLFAMTKRSNRIARNTAIALTEPVDEDKHGAEFRKDFRSYATKLAARVNELRANVSIGVEPEGLGDQYLTLRMEQLIARLAVIRNVYDIFPRRFGVQDREVMFNAFLGDFSQAYQKGQIFKGNIAISPEFCYVDDAMFKTLFDSMKDLERQYIGYLNHEGSDPIKWTLIEWAMLEISKKLILEQNKRKILGIYVKPEVGKPGHVMHAGTGVLYTLMRYYNEGKMALLDDAAFASYNSGVTMVEVVTNFMLTLSSEVEDLDSYEVCLNANHRAMWLAGLREIYGKDTDFKGPQGDTIPDFNNTIRWVPYCGKLPIILVQQPGNIQSIECVAGEMLNIKFETEMEEVKTYSFWKEGTSAAYVGKQFKTKAERRAHGLQDQVIFMNRPSVTLAADATTVSVSGDIRHYVTASNTDAVAITDFAGAQTGVAYMLEIGSDTNPSSIQKAGRFASITESFVPTKVGDYILVALNSNGDKFVELERCVDGIRTINVAVQPNVPGGR